MPFSRSAMPNALRTTGLPSWTTSSDAPGTSTWYRCIRVAIFCMRASPAAEPINGNSTSSAANEHMRHGNFRFAILAPPFPSLYRHVVLHGRRRFRRQRVMPPLQRIVPETLALHRSLQAQAVGVLRRRCPRRIGMREFTEVVEARAHVEWLATDVPGIALHQREIDRRAAAVARCRCDVVAEQFALVDSGIMLPLGALVGEI